MCLSLDLLKLVFGAVCLVCLCYCEWKIRHGTRGSLRVVVVGLPCCLECSSYPVLVYEYVHLVAVVSMDRSRNGHHQDGFSFPLLLAGGLSAKRTD